MQSMPSLAMLAAYAGALLLTLCLAARLTPRGWWRRANARALAVLAGGTLVLGWLLHALLAPSTPVQATVPPTALAPADVPVAGARYRTHDALNLRAAAGIGAPRLAVVPAGALVAATGRHQGDWWQVSVEVQGRRLEGWASSLWLRRGDERARTAYSID
ncbi:SH3 domain-containing protein [Massilia consociata]|uniref:SH3 domain-containing protein n=1 Tax=Massilia consociata TaxID=760117 RepID=A0ABV6FDS1_9BURK